MTDKEMQIAIAESSGWTGLVEISDIAGEFILWGYPPKDEMMQHVPNYLNDLNAMHEAEKILTITLPPMPHTESERTRYVNQLVEICGSKGAVIATARQRAEAFLKTIVKWVDET